MQRVGPRAATTRASALRAGTAALMVALAPAASAEDLVASAEPVVAAPTATSRPVIVAPGLDPAVLDLALQARACARAGGAAEARADDVISVVDFSLPSTEPRMWVIDLAAGRTLHHERVAHGRNTGELAATTFSNIPGSNQSSLGLYRTGEVYHGKHGRSLRLDGLDPGWNDRARDRAIVIHGAEYSTLAHVERWGRLGRSQGCPALDPAVTDAVIDTIRDGTLVFAYAPEAAWLAASPWLHCDAAPTTPPTPAPR